MVSKMKSVSPGIVCWSWRWRNLQRGLVRWNLGLPVTFRTGVPGVLDLGAICHWFHITRVSSEVIFTVISFARILRYL